MKITFEGKTFDDILDAIENVLTTASKKYLAKMSESDEMSGIPSAGLQGPGPKAEIAAAAPTVTPGAAAMAAADKMAKVRAAKGKGKAAAAPAPEPEVEEDDVFGTPPVDPAEMVKIRQKTIEDLQTAYANGHQKEVFELLSRFGNGAKSFRELPPDAFLPIRDAIDKGALT